MKDMPITLALLINACAILILAAAVVGGQGSSDCMARDRGMGLSGSGKPTSGMTDVKP